MNLPNSKEARASRLARLALFVWLAPLQTKLEMRYYASSDGNHDLGFNQVKNECGTSCCLVGHAPFILDLEMSDLNPHNWRGVSEAFMSYKSYTAIEWGFLFGLDNKNDRKMAAYRAYLYLNTIKDRVRPFFNLDIEKNYYNSFVEESETKSKSYISKKYKDFQNKNLKEALMSYLIPDDGTNGWVPGDPVP